MGRKYIGIKDKNGQKIYKGSKLKHLFQWSNEPREGVCGLYKGEWVFLNPAFLTTRISIRAHHEYIEVI